MAEQAFRCWPLPAESTRLQRKRGKFMVGCGAYKADAASRLLNIFQQVDLTKNFYFRCASRTPITLRLTRFRSYSYDLTNTLQINLTRPTSYPTFNQHFMWNHHLLEPAFDLGDEHDGENGRTRGHHKCSSWVLPFIHGFVDQASASVVLLVQR